MSESETIEDVVTSVDADDHLAYVSFAGRPEWRLLMWDTHQFSGGRYRLGYAFAVHGRVLIRGQEFSPSPHLAIDSEPALRELVGWLALKPGDTDAEFFADYSPEALAWAHEHGDELLCCWGQEEPTEPAAGFVDVATGRAWPEENA